MKKKINLDTNRYNLVYDGSESNDKEFSVESICNDIEIDKLAI